jgi:hypothetical protein
MAARMAATWAV